jgi:beta-lactamase regulating signal transducer with metallopeptidase domain
MVPLIVIQHQAVQVPAQVPMPQQLFNAPVLVTEIIPTQQINTVAHIDYVAYGCIITYCLITGFLLIRFGKNLYSIRKAIADNELVSYKNYNLVLISTKQTPHTFLNFIFLNRDDYRQQQIDEAILLHEMAHARQLHSIDVIFIELVQVVCWFNPFIFLYRRFIKLNHEFLADAAVLGTHYNIINYQNLLIHNLSGLKSLGITNQFNYAITKKRLIMMTKTTSATAAWLSRLAIIPITIAAFTLFTTKTEAQQQVAAPAEKVGKPKQETPHREVNTKQKSRFIFSNFDYPYTEKGVSPELLDEYKTIVDKYEPIFTAAIKAHGKNHLPPDQKKLKVTDIDQARLKEIYGEMSKKQQNQQLIGFMKGTGDPLPRTSTTAQQLETWKDAQTYGVWLNGKKIINTELNNYKAEDFEQVTVSRLTKTAINYKNYKYQVDLMTTDYYNNYRQQVLNNKKISIMYSRTPPEAKQAGVVTF